MFLVKAFIVLPFGVLFHHLFVFVQFGLHGFDDGLIALQFDDLVLNLDLEFVAFVLTAIYPVFKQVLFHGNVVDQKVAFFLMPDVFLFQGAFLRLKILEFKEINQDRNRP